MRSAAVAVIALFSTLGLTQSIDPESVDIAQRDAWCLSQVTQCPLLCTQVQDGSADTVMNDCDSESLTFSCVCANNVTPNATQYTQTVPYFICTESNNQCVTNCNGDTECARVCREERICAAEDPPKGTNTAKVSTVRPTATDSGSSDDPENTGAADFTGLGGDPAPTDNADGNDPNAGNGDKEDAAPLSLNLAQSYGFAVVFTGLFAGFALLL